MTSAMRIARREEKKIHSPCFDYDDELSLSQISPCIKSVKL